MESWERDDWKGAPGTPADSGVSSVLQGPSWLLGTFAASWWANGTAGGRGSERGNSRGRQRETIGQGQNARRTSANMHDGRWPLPLPAAPGRLSEPPSRPPQHRHRGGTLNGPRRDTAPLDAPRRVRQSPNASHPRQGQSSCPRKCLLTSKTQLALSRSFAPRTGTFLDERVLRPSEPFTAAAREDCIQHRDSRLPSRMCLLYPASPRLSSSFPCPGYLRGTGVPSVLAAVPHRPSSPAVSHQPPGRRGLTARNHAHAVQIAIQVRRCVPVFPRPAACQSPPEKGRAR
jgi:hypothetical protein